MANEDPVNRSKGRPKAENPRKPRFPIYLTDEEYAVFEQAAKEASMTIGGWLRKAGLDRAKTDKE